MLAHELRNPLASIANILQVLTLTSEENKTILPAVNMMSRQVNTWFGSLPSQLPGH